MKFYYSIYRKINTTINIKFNFYFLKPTMIPKAQQKYKSYFVETMIKLSLQILYIFT